MNVRTSRAAAGKPAIGIDAQLAAATKAVHVAAVERRPAGSL